MSKSMIFLLLCLCFGDKAHTLICYTTNTTFLPEIALDFQNIKHKLQDCDEYISRMSSTEAPIEHQVLHCFTISADYLDIVFKGCIPEGRCDNMTKAFKQMIQISARNADFIGNVHCQECAEDGCNSEDEDTFRIFNNSTPEVPSTTKTTEKSVQNRGGRIYGSNRFLLFSILCFFLCSIIRNGR